MILGRSFLKTSSAVVADDPVLFSKRQVDQRMAGNPAAITGHFRRIRIHLQGARNGGVSNRHDGQPAAFKERQAATQHSSKPLEITTW